MDNFDVTQIIQDRQNKNKNERIRRLRWLEERVPEYTDLTSTRNSLMSESLILRLKGDADKADLNEQLVSKLDEKEKIILKELGLPENFLSDIYDCDICKDTGYLENGQMCQCLKVIFRNQRYNRYDLTEKTKEYNFNNYNLNIFSDEMIPNQGFSPRFLMQSHLESAKNYIKEFKSNDSSLYLYGDVGTGKTYLVSCIANALIEEDIDIVYLSAPNLINYLYEDINKRNSMNRSHKDIFKNVELLIIDDLGTESSTDFTLSSLTEIIDYRILSNKKTIITSNYKPTDLIEKQIYPERLVSRIIGHYTMLPFLGRDLRNSKTGVNQ